MRKRSRKEKSKGNFERNTIKSVLGLKKNKYDNQMLVKVRWDEEVEIKGGDHDPSQSGLAEASTLQQLEQNMKKVCYQPGDSYVPISFMKQQYPEYLLEYFERQVGLTDLGYQPLNKERQ